MKLKIVIALCAGLVPIVALAQQPSTASSSASQPAGVQAQGSASTQGSASVQRAGSAVTSQGAASAAASGSVSKGDKSASADSGAATNAVLTQSLDARRAKPGDPVAAKTTEPTKTSEHGTLPKGTKLLGHVTEAKAAGSGEGQSMLAFTFDRAILKDRREVPIHSTINALAAADSAASLGTDVPGASMPPPSAGVGRSGLLGGGASAVGSLGATAGSTLGGTGRMASGLTGSVGSTIGAGAQAMKGGAGAIGGLDARGLFKAGSHGVFGFKDLSLAQSAAGDGNAVLTSSGRTVHLDSGTRMLLSVEGATEESTSGATSASSSNAPSAPGKATPGDKLQN